MNFTSILECLFAAWRDCVGWVGSDDDLAADTEAGLAAGRPCVVTLFGSPSPYFRRRRSWML